MVIRELGLEKAKASSAPGVKAVENDNIRDAKKYRAITARLNYLSPDRVDIGFAVKEAARNMSKPTNGDWGKLKRIGRYLLAQPRLVSVF